MSRSLQLVRIVRQLPFPATTQLPCRVAPRAGFKTSSTAAATADPARGGVTFDFTGRKSLVTGGASGIGKAVVAALHASGAHVVAVDANEDALAELQAELGPDRCSVVAADLSTAEGVARATGQALEQAGGAVDHLVCSAGVGRMQSMMDVDIGSFDLMMAVNCRAALQMSQLVAQALIDRGTPGAIVHVSSQSSSTAIRDRCAYSLTKAGFVAMKESEWMEDAAL